uniref:Potassium channel domain-containing protein n=1 Tax=Ciona savignyi TaxID=51511 RepID=H2Y7N9_CIOSA
MFAALGDKFAKIFKKFDEKITTKAKSSLLRKLLVFLLATTSLSLLCCVIPAFIFVAVEKWHYYEAFYYSFITLTTIGFGDFVVGANADLTYPTVYNVAVYFWILFGLAYMAAVISISSGYMKETGKSNRRKVKQGEPDVIESGPDGIYNATDDIALPNGESTHNSFPQDGDEKPVTTLA